MKRIGILTAGGDTPALNPTILGAVTRACQRRVEVFGFIKGFNGLLNPRLVPAGDHHRVSAPAEFLRQPTAYALGAAGNHDTHGFAPPALATSSALGSGCLTR